MRRNRLGVMIAALVATTPALPSASADRVDAICASRIYDYLRQPVANFAIDFRPTDMIAKDAYARYRTDLEAAAAPFGYDPQDRSFTLHESLSSFPFLNRGLVLEAVLVLCAAGGEKDNLCRRADYYVYDGALDQARLSLILDDMLRQSVPAPVDSCDFGQCDWSAVD